MKTNWFLAVLAWLAGIAIIVGVVMVIQGQPASTDLLGSSSDNPGLVWAGSGLIGFGLLCVVAALVGGALVREMRLSVAALTVRDDAPVRPKSLPRVNNPPRKGGSLTWSDGESD